VITLVGVLALLAAPPLRSFGEERQLLDRRLATLRRMLPDGPTPAADVAIVREIANSLKLQGFDALARPPLEQAGQGAVLVDVAGLARFVEIDRLFRQIALHQRLIDMESLTLAPAAEDAVQFKAVLRFPFRPKTAPLPAPPLGTRPVDPRVPKAQADTFVRDQALALAKSEAVAAIRRTRRNPRLFLAELAAIVRERPVVLTHASLADEFQVRGLTVGEAPSLALEARFGAGFFRVADFLMLRQGACRSFEVRGTSPVAGPDAELPLPTEDPFRQDAGACRVDRDTERRGIVEAAQSAKRPGPGPLTLRLRDVDLADVFYALHALTGESFVVDGDVVGRFSLEMIRVTLDEALVLLRKTGVRIDDDGGLRRVSRASNAVAPALVGPPLLLEESPKRASFSLKRSDVRELLAVLTDLEPAYAALGPQASYGRVSLWTRDIPMSELRAAILEVAGLSERLEDGRRILYRPMAADDPVFPVAEAAPVHRLVLRPQDVDTREFELAGVAANGGRWTAFGYSPTGALHAYAAGDRLADARIKSVDSTDVTLESDDGVVRVMLPPLK
jgi:hypothetical protein